METQITVRNVDTEIFREFKSDATRRGIVLGAALNLAMEKFMSSKKKNFMSLKPFSWGKGTEHLSKEVDEILYTP